MQLVDAHQVVAGDEVVEHAAGELVDHLGQRLLGQVGGPGGYVHHPEAGLDLDHVGQVVGQRRVYTSLVTPACARADTSSRT